MDLSNIDKVQAIIVRLRSGENVETSKNYLIAMLEELLKKEDVEIKKKKLTEEYGLVMCDETERRIHSMCNLSEVIIEKGEWLKLIELVCKKLQKGKAVDEIAEELEESADIINKICDAAVKYDSNPENKEKIYNALF